MARDKALGTPTFNGPVRSGGAGKGEEGGKNQEGVVSQKIRISGRSGQSIISNAAWELR